MNRAEGKDLEATASQSLVVDAGSLFPLADCRLVITVEDGYVKAYASPQDGAGIISYGLQGRIRDEISVGVHKLVEEFLEANRPASATAAAFKQPPPSKPASGRMNREQERRT